MTSEAKIASCRRNGKRSIGPKTPEGRERSSMNAYKHGLKSKKETLIREDSYAFENRKQKWIAKVNPTDDMGEFLAYQTVAAWTEIEYAERANAERTATLIDTSEDTEIEAAYELGRRLFHDRCGPTAVYGNLPASRTKKEREKKTSFSGICGGADDPAKLVAELETTAFGCIWLRDQWEELLEQAGHLWQSPDRLKSIRLLGRQPAAAATDRTIADIFVACDALHHSGTTAFADLFSDMEESQLKKFMKRVKERWPDLFDIDDKEKGRAHLVGLAEENIERLNELIGEFEKKSDEIARRTVERLTRDNTPEGHRMRNYVDKSRDALDRRMAKYDKYKEKMKDQDERNPRRINDEVGPGIGRAQGIERGAEETSGRASGGLGTHRHVSPRQRMGLDRPANGGGMPEEGDLSWAYELAAHSADVSDASGIAGSCDNAPPREVDALATRLEPLAPGITKDHSNPLDGTLAPVSGGEEHGMSEPFAKDRDFANEPKLDDLTNSAQSFVSVDVATDFEVEPSLDNVARKGRDVDGRGRPEDGELKAMDDAGKAADEERRADDGREKAVKGHMTSASELIDEVFPPSPTGGKEVHGTHSRSP